MKTKLPRVSAEYIKFHKRRKKPHSEIIAQLHIGETGSNLFLSERRVLGGTSGRSDCGTGNMKVQHILRTCPWWNEKRQELRLVDNNPWIVDNVQMFYPANVKSYC